MDPRHFTELVGDFPDEPENEVRRFARARDSFDESKKMYKQYRKWRRHQGRPELLVEASAKADPRFLSTGGLDEDGDAVVLVEGARFQTGHNDAYSALICARLDSVLPPVSLRRLVVLVDVRPGKGWPNHPPTRFVSFIKDVASLVSNMYPERLKTIVVYPLPSVLTFVLSSCILAVLDKVTRDKVKILGYGTQQQQLDRSRDDKLQSPTSPSTPKKRRVVDPCPATDLNKLVSLDMLPVHARSRHYGLH